MRRETENPQAVQATNNFVAALCRFVIAHGGPCYRNWSWETLHDYFRFHLVHHTLAWTGAPGPDGGFPKICGVMVAWQTTSERLDAVCPTGRVVFDWTPNALTGDCVWVADVVTTAPGAWLALARCFAQRYPHWLALPAFTYRKGKRHAIPVAYIANLSAFNGQPSTLAGGK